jgi:UDP-N-acetylglucosamine--N-acetylmuramyl-(pentapeptide) pyrophosphoryl-undecaprenol N-acetylglucosamine transferase
MEAALVTRSGVPFTAIPAAGVHGVGLRALPGNLVRLARGTLAARRILANFHPDVLLFTGGYVAAPLAVAGSHIPALVFCPDIQPGYALKFLGRFARTIAVTAPDSTQYFPAGKKIVATGYPLRPDLANWDRASAQAHFGLSDALPVVLVTGGSKGAQTINRVLRANLPQLLNAVQVLHISGSADWAAVQSAHAGLPATLAGRYHTFEFLHEDMGAALAAADLAVSRAGASTLGEYPNFGLPAVLVPYPYAWRYQKINAAYLQEHGAACLLPDEEMPEKLLPLILELTGSPQKLADMRRAMQALARPNAAAEIADLVRQLAQQKKERGQ